MSAQCGCQLSSTPQGVAHLDPMTQQIPLVIPSSTFTNGVGPFGVAVVDTGPAGLSYGTNRVLYVGNVDVNGDYYQLDLSYDGPGTYIDEVAYSPCPLELSISQAMAGGAMLTLVPAGS